MAPEAPAPDPIEQLTKLAALKDSGALAEAEFEAERARFSGRDADRNRDGRPGPPEGCRSVVSVAGGVEGERPVRVSSPLCYRNHWPLVRRSLR